MKDSTHTKDKFLELLLRDTSHESYALKELIASALDIDDLRDIQRKIHDMPEQSTNSGILNNFIMDKQEEEQWIEKERDKCRVVNHDVKELLAWYGDKKSGKMTIARKELQKRFLYLSEEEQRTIMATFLASGKTDREWCYNTLRKWWRDDLKAVVLDAWHKYHEERCGWVITKFCSADEMRPIADELSYDSNYYNLCKRLGGEKWFHIDTQKLFRCCDDLKFMWVMSQSADGLPLDKAMSILYSHIAKFLVDAKESDNAFKVITDSINTNWSFECEKFLYAQRLYDVEKILSNMCRMGYVDEVLDFIDADNKLHNDFWAENKGRCQGNFDKEAMATMTLEYIEKFLSQKPADVSIHIPEKKRQEYYHIWGAGRPPFFAPYNPNQAFDNAVQQLSDKLDIEIDPYEDDDIPF